MDYVLVPSKGTKAKPVRVVGPRNRNLRLGGGRKDQPGWTDQKLRANRRRFNALRRLIRTCLTILYPSKATPADLLRLSRSIQSFCKEHGIPARAVWEGPGKHQHIALGIECSEALEKALINRLNKLWLKLFGESMPADAFLWDPRVNPDKIASYLSKTRSKKHNGLVVKKAWPWMTFNPVWEVRFSKLVKAEKAFYSIARKTRSKRGVQVINAKPVIRGNGGPSIPPSTLPTAAAYQRDQRSISSALASVPSMNFNITSAEIRIEGPNERLYITLDDGTKFLAAGGKACVLACGVAMLPEEIQGETNFAFLDPDDEESQMFEVPNSTRDPVYVHLCRIHYVETLPPRKLAIPTIDEAKAAKWKAYPDGILELLPCGN